MFSNWQERNDRQIQLQRGRYTYRTTQIVEIHEKPENHGGRAYRCMCPMGVQNSKGKVATIEINSFKNLNNTAHRHHAFALCGVGGECKTLTNHVPQLHC